jgi:hypothetical protein
MQTRFSVMTGEGK